MRVYQTFSLLWVQRVLEKYLAIAVPNSMIGRYILFYESFIFSFVTHKKALQTQLYISIDLGHYFIFRSWFKVRYRLDGTGFGSQWGRDFPHLSRTALGPYPASYTRGTGSLPGVKRTGRCVDQPSPLAPRLKKEYNYNSTPHLGLHGLLWGEHYLYLYSWCIVCSLDNIQGC